jgi:hypothetical protein
MMQNHLLENDLPISEKFGERFMLFFLKKGSYPLLHWISDHVPEPNQEQK